MNYIFNRLDFFYKKAYYIHKITLKENYMNTTLIIMAAGIGSRYGKGIKQLAKIGPHDEIIMDYSIYDALEAGFNKVVFIIRKDIEKEFKEIIGNRIEKHIQVEYVFQEINNIPEGCTVPEGRIKPWGTGQAILSCKGIVNEPFVIINADDYYGKVAFKKLHDFLIEDSHRNSEFTMAMAGFILKNTLSDNGTVTRGICVEDEAGYLHRVIETKGIIRNNQGTIDCDTEESKDIIQENNRVSMNMWAGYPCFIDYLENGFKEFLLDDSGDELTKEYLLPIIVDQLIKTNRASVKVLETTDKWFGVTYPEDKQIVQDSINELIEQGIYPEKLWK